ncbi:hypothetical protein GGR56DRAFT_698122 [Xylariaceae sp. FL0804]|nr:hypothetical protein GGR56DRAFT_698122 [Xylariaceae sp. FL0804]
MPSTGRGTEFAGHGHRSDSPPRRQRACLPCTKAKARCNFADNRVQETADDVCATDDEKPEEAETNNGPSGNLAAGTWGVTNSFSGESLSEGRPVPLTTIPAVPGAAPSEPPGLRNEFVTKLRLGIGDPWPRPVAEDTRPRGPGFGLTWDQAEKGLAAYHSVFIYHLPFVAFEQTVSARQLYDEKPLLFMALMLATLQLTHAKKQEMRRSIDKWIGHHLMAEDENSLGILQGLIVYIAWGGHEYYLDRKITQLIYLAVAQAHRLGITRPPPSSIQKVNLAVNPRDVHEVFQGRVLTDVREERHTLEEQRAFLGCFYLLSVNSSQCGRRATLESDYVDVCLRALEAGASEYPTTDFILVKFVGFRRVAERVDALLPSLVDHDYDRELTPAVSAEMEVLRGRLDQLFENVAGHHPKFALFWMMQMVVLVRMYLPATYMRSSSEEGASARRLGHMISGLRAIRTFFELMSSIGPSGLLFAPFTLIADWTFVIVGASRLLTLEPSANDDGTGLVAAGWSAARARRTIDFPAFLDGLAAKMDAARRMRAERVAAAAVVFPDSFVPDSPDHEAFDFELKYINKVRLMKTWYSERVSSSSSASSLSGSGSGSGSISIVTPEGSSEEEERRDDQAGSSLPPQDQTRTLNRFFFGIFANEGMNFTF